MYVWDVNEPSTYRKWNIIDLWDYLYDFYNDNAQVGKDPATYGARYDGPVPSDFPNDPAKQTDVTNWRRDHATEVDGIWYWTFSNGKIVSKWYDLTTMWRSDITNWKRWLSDYPERMYAKNYHYMQRNYYVVSAEAWRVILRERYSDFKYLTSFKYDYVTGTRDYYDTIAEAAQLLYRTFGAWEHDKVDALTKLMFALRKEYDPVENYDKYSELETHKYGSENVNYKPEGKETDTLEKSGIETNALTKTGKEKTTMSRGAHTDTTAKIPFDGDTWKNTERIEGAQFTDTDSLEYGADNNDRIDTSKTTYGGPNEGEDRKDTNTHEFDITRQDNTWTQYGKTPDGDDDDRYDKIIEHTHGNIGVTTSQQMIQSQFPIEYYDEIEHYSVSEFVHKYLVLA